MSRFIARVVVLLALFGITGAFAHAQEAPMTYVVVSQQSVNARTCPRLNCGVARTFDPGAKLAVVGVAQGDIVANSDQWLQIDADGHTLYVHSSLATPTSKFSGDAGGPNASADTVDWVTHTGESFALDTPRGWINAYELLSDEEYLNDIAQFLGEDPEDFQRSIQDMCGSGVCDLVLVDIQSGAALFMMHEDLEDMPRSPEVWKAIMVEEFEQGGAEVISGEVVDLPAGEAARLHLRMELGLSKMEMDYVVYIVIVDDQIYLLIFTMDPSGAEDYTPVIDGIAASFRATPPSTDDQDLLSPEREPPSQLSTRA